MDFDLLGKISDIETIAEGRGIRDLPRLRRLYGKGHWRKMKGVARIRPPDGRIRMADYTGMKRMGSARRSSKPGVTSTRPRRGTPQRFVVCVRNTGYRASLEQDKIYVAIPDAEAAQHGQLRVVDESGGDYLFSADRFVAIAVPAAVRASLLKAS
jgi:hypothetical protein